MGISEIDGKVQLGGHGSVLELDALTTGSCKLIVDGIHWFELVKTTLDPVLKVVVSKGEAMVRKVSVRVFLEFHPIFPERYREGRGQVRH